MGVWVAMVTKGVHWASPDYTIDSAVAGMEPLPGCMLKLRFVSGSAGL